MTKHALVSVILPSYNHEEFVARAVESVLEQQIKGLELIVVDDGSTDSTPDQVAKITDSRVRLIRLEQNRLRHPRNLALELAKGKYIAFQNSDDEWLPEKLLRQIDVLEKQKNIVACFTDIELVDENNEVLTTSWANGLFTTENRARFAWLKHFFTAGNCLCISSAVVRNEAIKKAGAFRGNLIQLSDFDLWVRLAAIGDFHIVDEKLTLMRITGGKPNRKVEKEAEAAVETPAYQLRINLSGPIPRMVGKFLPGPVKAMIRMLIDTKKIIEKPVVAPEPEPVITSSDNLSAPKPTTINRGALEHVEVLGNFSRPPIIDLIPNIFEDMMPDLPDSRCVRQAWLAKYAWTFEGRHYALFADRVMTSILENEKARSEVTDVFGAEIIREYFQRRGRLSYKIDEIEQE